MNNETIQSLRNYALADKAKTTPRTDAATIPFDAKGCERDDRVPVSFARQLERELQQATADNSSLAERLTAAELERDRLGAELEELQGSHDLNQIASDALNDLRADLARVTAERQNWKEWAEEARAMFHKQIDAAAVMKTRAEQAEQRVAELEATIAELTTDGNAATLAANLAKASKRNAELVEQLKAYGKYAHDTTLEDQNAELVAALREVDEIVNDANHSAEDRLCAAANRLLNTRAESATPNHIPDAAKMVSATPAKHCEDCDPSFRCFDGRENCCKAVPAVEATPAKHPDTERLDWLEAFYKVTEVGHWKWHELEDRMVADGFRSAIDAARKQEASK